MNLKNLMNDNYITFYMLSDNYIDNQYSTINLPVYAFKKIFRYVKKIIFYFYVFFRYYSSIKDQKNKVIFYAITKNNFDSLCPVYKEIKKYSIMLTTDYRLARNAVLVPQIIPLIISILLTPVFLKNIFQSVPKVRKRIILYLDDILLSMGFTIFVKYYLKLLKPKAIVFANDHSFPTRSLIKSAERMNIPCFYIQHSAVTDIFPPIISSYALLEGEDSLKKYYPDGYSTNKVFLIGSPKFDEHKENINMNDRVKKIGLCSTPTLDKEEMIELIKLLQNKFSPENIYFRPHPTEIRIKKYYKFIKSSQINISNSLSEGSYQFLNKVDVVISGNSSILLEAALFNIYPIYWDSILSESKYNEKPYDKYGFVEGGIAHSVDSKENIVGLLNDLHVKKPNVRYKTKLYCDTVGTKWDGKSTDLAVQIISNKIGLNYKQ